MIFLLQQPNSDVMLSHIRTLEPTLHDTRIGGPFHYRDFLLLTAEAFT